MIQAQMQEHLDCGGTERSLTGVAGPWPAYQGGSAREEKAWAAAGRGGGVGGHRLGGGAS